MAAVAASVVDSVVALFYSAGVAVASCYYCKAVAVNEIKIYSE